jgi:hypothetical protein
MNLPTKRGIGKAIDTPPETIVKKIDSILYELEEMRQSILEQAQHSDGNLAEELYGVLGQRTWDEYDPDLDWQRFCGMSQSILDFKGELP